MTPEELALKERDVAAREKNNELTEQALEIEEKKSKRNLWGMIAAALIGLGGMVYVKADKDKDVAVLTDHILELRDTIHNKDCKREVEKIRLSYSGNMCVKILEAQRKTWATCKINNEILRNRK